MDSSIKNPDLWVAMSECMSLTLVALFILGLILVITYALCFRKMIKELRWMFGILILLFAGFGFGAGWQLIQVLGSLG